MKNNLLTLATILTLGFFTNNANAQAPIKATATTASAATIVQAISVNANTTTLNFGHIASSAASGTVSLGSAGTAAIATGGVAIVAGGTQAIPTYTVTGAGDKAFTIGLPSDGQFVGNGTAAQNMALTLFESDSALDTTLSSGTYTFKVGATLNVGANQPAGEYNGTFPVTVQYN